MSSSGTPVLLVASNNQNIASARNCHTFIVQALPNTSGFIYLLSNSTAADTTNYTNVIYAFQTAGEVFGQGSTAVNDLDLTNLYVDAANNGNGLLVSILVQ